MIEFFGALFDGMGITKEQRVLIMRTGWVTFVSAHIMWVCGWLAFAGLSSPFANATSLETLTKLVMEDRVDRLQREILDTRTKQCKSTSESEMQLYTELLNDLYLKYQALQGKSPLVPDCHRGDLNGRIN